MNRSIILMMGLCAFVGATAQEKALRVELTDGKAEYFKLAENPVMTFEGENVRIASPALTSDYPRADVVSMTFVDASAGISAPAQNATVYSYDGTTFSCPGNAITVYDLQGVRLADAADSVSLAGFPAGVYVIRTNNKSIKVTKK